ncbi:MAG: hypothetical protein COB41_02310 [Proteobacteria bacterium]|nr:MAG: hypothetical protein COB41_02310 [Pseudomonadota bacterium]
MSNKQQTTEAAPDEEAIMIEGDALEQEPIEKTTPKVRRWPLFTLAFIIGSATSIFALNYYQQNYMQQSSNGSMSFVSSTAPTHKNEPVDVTPKEVSATINSPSFKTPASTQISTAISSEEGKALITAISTLQNNIQDLQNELQTLRQQQQSVAHSQSMLESMQLHSRLTWIMKHNSHLPQIKLAWQEISLLPSLTTEQRTHAESMLKLAEQRQNDVHQWQQEIDHLIINFKPSEYDNIIPAAITTDSSNPWLQWLVQQFSLKRSQSSQEAALRTLKNTLQHIKQGMNLEQWPTGTAWTALRAQLQLRLVEQFKAADQAETKQAPALQLPENFEAIQADVKKLRQAAKSWLEES